jgi:hypothetical protein
LNEDVRQGRGQVLNNYDQSLANSRANIGQNVAGVRVASTTTKCTPVEPVKVSLPPTYLPEAQPVLAPSGACYAFNADLQTGDVKDEVILLRVFLNRAGISTPLGSKTYDTALAAALGKYQTQNPADTVSASGSFFSGVGQFLARTRTFVNSKCLLKSQLQTVKCL